MGVCTGPPHDCGALRRASAVDAWPAAKTMTLGSCCWAVGHVTCPSRDRTQPTRVLLHSRPSLVTTQPAATHLKRHLSSGRRGRPSFSSAVSTLRWKIGSVSKMTVEKYDSPERISSCACRVPGRPYTQLDAGRDREARGSAARTRTLRRAAVPGCWAALCRAARDAAAACMHGCAAAFPSRAVHSTPAEPCSVCCCACVCLRGGLRSADLGRWL
jgi:hypothetical protein